MLRTLNKSLYVNIVQQTKDVFDQLCALQSEVLKVPTQQNLLAAEEASNKWNQLANAEEQFFKQKSRVSWLRYGDHNTTFFHRVAQSRAAKNVIKRLTTDGGETITKLNQIKEEVVNYFKRFLQ